MFFNKFNTIWFSVNAFETWYTTSKCIERKLWPTHVKINSMHSDKTFRSFLLPPLLREPPPLLPRSWCSETTCCNNSNTSVMKARSERGEENDAETRTIERRYCFVNKGPPFFIKWRTTGIIRLVMHEKPVDLWRETITRKRMGWWCRECRGVGNVATIWNNKSNKSLTCNISRSSTALSTFKCLSPLAMAAISEQIMVRKMALMPPKSLDLSNKADKTFFAHVRSMEASEPTTTPSNTLSRGIRGCLVTLVTVTVTAIDSVPKPRPTPLSSVSSWLDSTAEPSLLSFDLELSSRLWRLLLLLAPHASSKAWLSSSKQSNHWLHSVGVKFSIAWISMAYRNSKLSQHSTSSLLHCRGWLMGWHTFLCSSMLSPSSKKELDCAKYTAGVGLLKEWKEVGQSLLVVVLGVTLWVPIAVVRRSKVLRLNTAEA